jgi:glycosyltransferase involved in cell wall biosynthesis
MRIAQVAPLWFALPPKKFGGTELVAYNLSEELVRRGHQVTVFASGDSKVSGKLISAWPKHIVKERIKSEVIPWNNTHFTLLNLYEAFSRADEFDIIHVHENSSILSGFFIDLVKTPVVSTLHNPFIGEESKDKWATFNKFRKHNYISISNAHRKSAKLKLNFVGTVYNGIDLEKYKFQEKPKGDYLVWLGRIYPNKGVAEAIKIAKRANKKLILAGNIAKNSPVSCNYFEQKIKPQFRKGKVEYIGEVNLSQKIKLLKNAFAFLNPIQWEEPFGLVMIEAMACGTPVIAFNRGAAPEIVKNNKTGFIVKNEKEMINAIKKINKIKRKDCRSHIEKNFSVEKMTIEYEKIYKKLIERKKL